MSNVVTYKGVWQGPRWLRVGPAIQSAAHLNGVNAVVHVDKGWIREEGRYTLIGERDDVYEIVDWLQRAMEESHERRSR